MRAINPDDLSVMAPRLAALQNQCRAVGGRGRRSRTNVERPQCGAPSVQHLTALGMRPEIAARVAAQIEEEIGDGGEPHLDRCAERAREAADRWIGAGSRITPVHEGVDRMRIRRATEAAAAPAAIDQDTVVSLRRHSVATACVERASLTAVPVRIDPGCRGRWHQRSRTCMEGGEGRGPGPRPVGRAHAHGRAEILKLLDVIA